MDRNLSLIFFGSFQQYSADFLRVLYGKYAVNAVVTASPKPAGRHLKITPTDTEVLAKSLGIPVFYDFENLPVCDFILVAGYGKLIPKKTINHPKIMAVNFHPSLLPQYSGSTPVEYALLNGETQTGISFIKISPTFDTGDIIYQEKVPIQSDDNRMTMYDKLFKLGSQKAIELLPQIASGNFALTPQPKLKNSIKSRKLTRQDGFIEYSEYENYLRTAHWPLATERKLKAFMGWPGVWTIDPSGQRIVLPLPIS